MKEANDNTTNENRTGRQFKVEVEATSKPKARAGKDYKILGRKRPSFKTAQAAGHVLRCHSLR